MSETKETVAAAAIIDVMMNGDKSWRDRLADSDFLESADWATASAYARAVIEATTVKGDGLVEGQLTEAFIAMAPLQKWETLALNGLLGTREPWIEDMRQSLKAQADTITTLKGEIERLRAGLRQALDMIVDGTRDGGYSVSEFRDLQALSQGTDNVG